MNGLCDPYVKAVTGNGHACALRESGSVDCWGDNSYFGMIAAYTDSYLAAGEPQTPESPVRLRWTPPASSGAVDLAAIDLSAGAGFTCFIWDDAGTGDGPLYCVGLNSEQRIGRVSGGGSNVPVPVEATSVDATEFARSRFRRIVTRTFHSCAIDTMSRLFCWGHNSYGQLGRPDDPATSSIDESSANSVAQRVSLPGSVIDVALGERQTCALVAS